MNAREFWSADLNVDSLLIRGRRPWAPAELAGVLEVKAVTRYTEHSWPLGLQAFVWEQVLGDVNVKGEGGNG